MWFFLFLVLPLAGLYYVSWHIYNLLPLPTLWRWCVVALCVASVLAAFLNFGRVLEKLPLAPATALYEVGYSAIFVLLYLAMTFLLLDLGRLVHLVPGAWLRGNAVTGLVIFFFLTAVFVGGNIHYRNKTRQPLNISSTKIKKSMRIVLLSDLHLGYHNRRGELERWVRLINSERPDLVLIGGDIVDISTRPLEEERVHEVFHRIEAPVYACLGNHEYYSGKDPVLLFYRRAGITLLRDSVVQTAEMNIIGRDDRTNPHRKPLSHLMGQCNPAKFTLLLDHQPYHLEETEKAGIDFQFSGHTHHGQVWPFSWITESMYEKAFGPWLRGHTHYYVSSGMGIWGGKFRIGTRSEYVVLTLNPQN